MGEIGEQCRDVACYVWKMGEIGEQCRDVACYVWEMGEMGKLTQNSTLPVPCSLTNDKSQILE